MGHRYASKVQPDTRVGGQGISRPILRFPSRFDGRFPSKETSARGLLGIWGLQSLWFADMAGAVCSTLSLAVFCGFMSLSFPCLGSLLPDYF